MAGSTFIIPTKYGCPGFCKVIAYILLAASRLWIPENHNAFQLETFEKCLLQRYQRISDLDAFFYQIGDHLKILRLNISKVYLKMSVFMNNYPKGKIRNPIKLYDISNIC
jgi:hypothetical protein